MPVFEFSRGGTAVAVDTPQYGYTVQIHLALAGGDRLSNGDCDWFDRGRAYDFRTVDAEFVLDQVMQKQLQDFFTDSDLGRGNRVQVRVPAGCYLFGPDLGGGDRRFTAHMLGSSFGGAQRSPYLRFNTRLTLVLDTAPAYALPDRVVRSRNLSIGGVDGLHYPPNWFAPEPQMNVLALPQYGGGASVLDRTADADAAYTSFVLAENALDTAYLCDYLVRAGRGNDIVVIGRTSTYLFGRANAGSGTAAGSGSYVVGLGDPLIKVTHKGVDVFETELRFVFKSYTPV